MYQPDRIVVSLIIGFITVFLNAQETKMVTIKGGTFVPLYGATTEKPVAVSSFKIDVYPVTNAEYLNFVNRKPEYTRSGI